MQKENKEYKDNIYRNNRRYNLKKIKKRSSENSRTEADRPL